MPNVLWQTFHDAAVRTHFWHWWCCYLSARCSVFIIVLQAHHNEYFLTETQIHFMDILMGERVCRSLKKKLFQIFFSAFGGLTGIDVSWDSFPVTFLVAALAVRFPMYIAVTHSLGGIQGPAHVATRWRLNFASMNHVVVALNSISGFFGWTKLHEWK